MEELIEVSQQDKVEDLSPHHIWTDEYAQSRLRWKPMLPLSIMLLRVYRMEQPVTVPYIPEYGGCTSWVDIIPPNKPGQPHPITPRRRVPPPGRGNQRQPRPGNGMTVAR